MFDRIKKFFSGANTETKSFNFGVPVAEFFGNTWNSFLTRKSYLDEYKGWVFRCIQLNAQEVASVKLHLRKKKDDEEVFENPILQLIYKPNPFITFSDLIENYQASQEMDGNAFWCLAKDKIGRIREIWPLRPDRVTVITSKEKYIAGYSYRPDGKSKAIFFEPDEILHFKTYNPINPVRGIGTVEAAIAAIDSDNYARLWNKKFFENSARPDVVLEYDGTMDEDSYKRTTEKWEQKYKGVENAGKTAVLRGGLKIKQLNFSQKEMDFVELRKFSRDEIFALFGIHKGVLFADDVNLANAQIALWSYARFTIKPRIRKLVEYLNEFLLPRLGYGDLYFTYDDPVPQDRDKQLAEYEKGWGKWLTTNDIRVREGLPEIDGGNDLLVSFSLLPMNQAKQIAGDNNKKQTKSISEQREKEGEIVWKAMIQRTVLYENKFKTGLGEIFKKEKNKVLDKLEGKKAIKSVDDYLPDDYSVSATIDLARPLLTALVKQEGEEAAKLLMLRTGVEQIFDFNKAIQDILERDIKKFAKEVARTTREQLKETLSEGINAGEGADDLKNRVLNIYEVADSRAEAIARTETIRSSNFATEESWKQSGVVEGKEWYTASDERVCDFCGPMHTKVIDINGNYFDKGDSAFGFKVDWSDVSAPPLHPQCRCTLLPVLVEGKSFNKKVDTKI